MAPAFIVTDLRTLAVSMAEHHPQFLTQEDYDRCREQIAVLPEQLLSVMEEITPNRLHLSYRVGGWTAAQIVNHLADSHMNGYIRMKLAVTANNPSVFGYDQDLWAATADGRSESIGESLSILEGLHRRWVHFLDSLTENDRAKSYFHSGYQETRTVDMTLSLYAWHGQHHVAQLKQIITALS